MGQINDLAKDIHQNALDHGWYDKERDLPELLCLVHSEISEALEEYRNGHEPNAIYFLLEKPEGLPIELADAVIRIFDMAEFYGIDIEKCIIEKHEYNKSRPYRHGNKVC